MQYNKCVDVLNFCALSSVKIDFLCIVLSIRRKAHSAQEIQQLYTN